MPLGASDVIRLLELSPHPEGGYFRETFRAEKLPFDLPGRGLRSASTAIYFLLQQGDFSAFHQIRSDEAWHHYLGAPLELHLIDAGAHTRLLLGSDLEQGERPQAVVPAGALQAARVLRGAGSAEDFALVGCTVAPGFDFSDFEMPGRASLLVEHPQHRELIEGLTRA